MKFFEKIFYFLFPLTYLKATPWEKVWFEIERSDFLKTIKIFFCVTLIGYISHYHTVDVAEGLAPSKLWFNYRYGMALLSLLGLCIYSFEKIHTRLKSYRLPAIVIIATFCYFQARTSIWYPKVPYLYSFAFILAGIAVLRTSVLKSTLVSLAISASIFPTLQTAGISVAMLYSAIFFTVSVIIFSRSKYTSDIKYFIATQKNIAQQKEIIEINMEFTNQIKSFLPKEISKRLVDCIQKGRMGVGQAVHQILSPKKVNVACLFSDIRGFTKSSNDLNGFVAHKMFPEVTACTNAIENKKGISRKIGDLIFAYFDNDEFQISAENALQAAIEIANINTQANQGLESDQQIKRFILLSSGEAIVGNLSGYSSSIEITAIGSPVNLLSRIDEVTKQPEVSPLLKSGDILMPPDFINQLNNKLENKKLLKIDLEKMNIKIRDFSDIKHIYVLREEAYSVNQPEARAAA